VLSNCAKPTIVLSSSRSPPCCPTRHGLAVGRMNGEKIAALE